MNNRFPPNKPGMRPGRQVPRHPNLGNGDNGNPMPMPMQQNGVAGNGNIRIQQQINELMDYVQQLFEVVGSVQNVPSKLADIEESFSVALAEAQRQNVPEQQRAGVIAYPDRYDFPMVLNIELRTSEGDAYGLTNDLVRALIQIDVDNPTFLERISFDLYKTDAENNTAPIGVFLSLSGQSLVQWLAAGATYEGRDFRWRIRTSSDDRIWQTGWRSSAMLDGDHRDGYILPAEYELRRNDSIIIEAQPIAPVPDVPQEYALNVYLHIYKMLLKGT